MIDIDIKDNRLGQEQEPISFAALTYILYQFSTDVNMNFQNLKTTEFYRL